MANTENGAEFSSVEYWRNRHNEYGTDPRGVGTIMMDSAENETIYANAVRGLTEILKHLPLPQNSKALDLGCGIGKMVPSFTQENNFHYTGVDVSETAVSIAQKTFPDSRFIMSNIADLPLDGPFDIIMQRTVFIHLTEDDYWNSVLREVKRLLAPGGIFIVHDFFPNIEEDAARSVSHVKQRLYSVYEDAFSKIYMTFDETLREAVCAKIPRMSPNTHFVRHC